MHVIINRQRVSFENRGDQVYCTSYDIARVFNKDHYNVLRDIQKLEKLEKEAHEEGVTPRHLNFEASAEVRKNGLFDKETKYYNLTRDIKITGVRPQSKRISGIVRKIYYDLGLNEAITVIPA